MQSFVRHHLLEAIRDGFTKAVEDENLSRSLRAEARLRLTTMPDEELLELWELVKLAAASPQRTAELVYKEISRSEGYTAVPVPNPSPSLKGTIKDASPGGRDERSKLGQKALSVSQPLGLAR